MNNSELATPGAVVAFIGALLVYWALVHWGVIGGGTTPAPTGSPTSAPAPPPTGGGGILT